MRRTTDERANGVGAVDAVLLGTLALVVLVLFVDERHVLPEAAGQLELSPSLLPLYTLYSLARMAAAYVLSLGFALCAGAWAAFSRRAARAILPALDVLQSVPILGFFPAAVFFFVGAFRGSTAGVEAAAVFLVFTSQAWNLAFSVYESLSTIPEDLQTAVRLSGALGAVRWRRLLLPACVPGLTYNSMLSWAGGWYFLIASELITAGPRTYTLEGLGSYVGRSIEEGRYDLTLAGLATLTLVVTLLHVVVWRPLEYWSGRFHYEYSTDATASTRPLIAAVIARAPAARRAWSAFAQAVGRFAMSTMARVQVLVTSRIVAVLLVTGAASTAGWLVYLGVRVASDVLGRPLPVEAGSIPSALLFSFLRLCVAYAISLTWTVPVAWWLSRTTSRTARVLPALQVLASLPATALFPGIVAGVAALRLDLNVASVALVLTGMQWYLLFNLVAGAQAMPDDLRELARASGVGGWLYFRRFFLPVAMPGLVTGSLTAWGGGWNALVLSEYVTAGGHTYTVHGIGALLDQATYHEGDLQMIVLTVMSMVVVILLLNRLVWRRLERWAHTRYRLEY